MYVGGIMVNFKQTLHTGCKKTKKRLTMEDSHSIWGTKDAEHKVKDDSITKLEKLTCKSGFKILLIEDDLTQLSMLRDILKDNEYINIVVSTSAEEAIEEIHKNHNISLILSDYRMEGDLNGYDVYKETKDYKFRPMFIIMSGYVTSEMVNLKKQGLLFLPKPYNIDNLVNIINRVYVKHLEHIIRGRLS